MAIILNPTVSNLGIAAPVLGPWFSQSVSIPMPAAGATSLGLDLVLPSSTDWFAPATGTLSLFVASASPLPPLIDSLQDAGGSLPFPDGRLVAYFRLLPEVEARLHALIGLLPAVTASPIGSTLPTAAGTPTRPQIRSLAIALPATTPKTPAGLYPFFGGAAALPGSDDNKKMAALGLLLRSDGTVSNAELPMTWLRRPGGAVTDRDKLLRGMSGTVTFWAFDRRGRAVDAGAVACWWSWLLATGVGADGSGTLQLTPHDIVAGDYPQANGTPVVCPFDAGRLAHLVDAHEGPVLPAFLGGRLKNAGTAVSANLLRASGTTAISLTVDPLPAPGTPPPPDNPQLDSLPRPRLAALPNGNYANSLTLWPGGALHAGLGRDFARVGLVEEELHLVGVVRRDSRAAVSTQLDRRQSAQNRPSTRVSVARTADTAPVLLANGRTVADAILAIPNATAPTRLVLGIADSTWGGTPDGPLPPAGAGPLPASLADSGNAAPGAGQYRLRPLTGGGALAADHQTILLEVNLGVRAALRAWPLGFDLNTGLHFRLTGGACRTDATGLGRAPMLLPNGLTDPEGLMSFDLLTVLTDATGAVTAQRSYADLRFSRPVPVGGTPPAVTGTWWVCETAATGSGALPGGAIPPGGHVVLLTDPPAIVDRTTIPAAAWATNTLRRKLLATDIVSLTAPSFQSTPDRADPIGRPLPREPAAVGDPKGGLDAIIGTKLHYLPRIPAALAASSAPYALFDRLDVAAASVSGTTAHAAIGSAPPAPWALEPAADFTFGFPGVPASIETHGVGVALTGAPAVAVTEFVRERTAGLGFTAVQGLTEPARSLAIQSEIALAAEAATALPAIADGAGAGPVAAVLRSCAFGLEGVPGVATAAIAANVFPFSQEEAGLETWLNSQISAGGGAGSALRSAAGSFTDGIARALDRRILCSGYGAREALTALLAAFDRAQDLVYLETPAIDMLPIESGGENLQLWSHLVSRMGLRRGLRVVLCVPTLLGAGTPKQMQAVRDHTLLDAIEQMRGAAGDRFAVFSPGVGAGRCLRIAGTAVVVDDAFALAGSTHLSRRGLSWDSSLAASVFDERVQDGRPQEVLAFRRHLLADRLGLPISRVADDAADLVSAIRKLDARGSARLSTSAILRPTDTPQNTDIDIWNPDGSRTDISLSAIATLFGAAVALTDTDHAIVGG